MPLHILAILVVFGLAIIIGAVHFAGGSQAVSPLEAESAAKRFSLDYPDFKISETSVSKDGKTVLLFSNATPRIGLVVQMGNRSLTRLISRKTLKRVELKNDGLEISIRDFTLPKVQVSAEQIDDLHILENHLDQLIGETT